MFQLIILLIATIYTTSSFGVTVNLLKGYQYANFQYCTLTPPATTCSTTKNISFGATITGISSLYLDHVYFYSVISMTSTSGVRYFLMNSGNTLRVYLTDTIINMAVNVTSSPVSITVSVFGIVTNTTTGLSKLTFFDGGSPVYSFPNAVSFYNGYDYSGLNYYVSAQITSTSQKVIYKINVPAGTASSISVSNSYSNLKYNPNNGLLYGVDNSLNLVTINFSTNTITTLNTLTCANRMFCDFNSNYSIYFCACIDDFSMNASKLISYTLSSATTSYLSYPYQIYGLI